MAGWIMVARSDMGASPGDTALLAAGLQDSSDLLDSPGQVVVHHDVLLEIDVQGAAQVRARHPQAVVVFIEAPSRQAQEERLRGRGDREDLIARRLAAAPEEERAGRALADHIVVNEDLDRAVEEVAAILESRRQ